MTHVNVTAADQVSNEAQAELRTLDATDLDEVSGGIVPLAIAVGGAIGFVAGGGIQAGYDFMSGVLDGMACANGNTALCPGNLEN